MLKKKQYAKWGTDEDDPDWGALKHVEEEEQFKLKKVEKVSRLLGLYKFRFGREMALWSILVRCPTISLLLKRRLRPMRMKARRA